MQADGESLLEAVQDLLLSLAGERDLDRVLRLAVDGLAAASQAALARIWLVEAGDICERCPARENCPTEIPCLHLAVSTGSSKKDPDADWSRIDGDFRRFPIGKRKIGSIAQTAEAVCVEDTHRDSRWIARPQWAKSEGIRGFGGQPLVFRGEVLGVVGVFTRVPFDAVSLTALRLVADHIAAAIATARAFDENATLRRQLESQNEYLRLDLEEAQAFGEIIGTSSAIRAIEEQIQQVAPTDASVLILGESGTGKELVAREVHRCSERGDHPLIRVNCASIPKELYESEFFGHVKGAFTGAVKDRVGRFAAADGGTLFLDEVGEIPLDLQSKLLRVLQEGQYERVGDDRTRDADVRIVAATNRDLAVEVREGRFREDLYYRLNVFPIEVPPLRERREDIPLLARYFLSKAVQTLKRKAELSEANEVELKRYPWPGNVRELQNAIERAVITAKAGRVDFQLQGGPERGRPLPADSSADAPADLPAELEGRPLLTDAELRDLERSNLLAALERAEGKIYGAGGAAELLGLKPTTLASRLQRMGIKSD